MLIFYANMPQYLEHLKPIYRAYKGDKIFIIKRNTRGAAGVIDSKTYSQISELKKILDTLCRLHKKVHYIVASYGNVRELSKPYLPDIPFALIEHGAGQSYDSKIPGWCRGSNKYMHRVKLFMATNKYCLEPFKKNNPEVKAKIIGCPKIDWVEKKPMTTDDPLIVFSWHWSCNSLPETLGGFDYWKSEVVNVSKHFNVAIHGHPRLQGDTEPFCLQNNIRFIKDFNEVLATADIYAIDNSSTMFEFALTGRPIIVLNNPWFRRDVNHGMRFWEFSNIGVNCDSRLDLMDSIDECLDDEYEANRERISSLIYPFHKRSTEEAIKTLKILSI